eukprot:372983-Amphidinium_carterae.2
MFRCGIRVHVLNVLMLCSCSNSDKTSTISKDASCPQSVVDLYANLGGLYSYCESRHMTAFASFSWAHLRGKGRDRLSCPLGEFTQHSQSLGRAASLMVASVCSRIESFWLAVRAV